MRGALLSLCLFILGFTPGFTTRAGAADLLSIRPWCDLEPPVRIDPGDYPIPMEKAAQSLLEEARVLLSGMVYGWSFVYFPGDTARKVEESFTLAPLAEIPWGSARLKVGETEVIETRLWARVSYALTESESRWRSAWESSGVALSTGRGKASAFAGPSAKLFALRDAIRDAIRIGLHTRIVNKPREITGEVVLWEDPQTLVRSGQYTAVAKVKLRVREIVPYRIF